MEAFVAMHQVRSRQHSIQLGIERVHVSFVHHVMIAFCTHVWVNDQRERLKQFPSGRSNWVEGPALVKGSEP
jgi:hypothetical protein